MPRMTFLCVLLTAALALAEEPSTAPSKLTATITGVEGLVQVRMAEDQPWQRATVNMTLTEGAEFRTGPKSAVRFIIPPDQTITLDRLGTIKLLQAVKDGGKVKTDVGMKYGRTRYDIEAAGGAEYESTIHSPASTLAVRGTKVSLYDQPPFVPEAVSLTGRAEFRNAKRQMVAFGSKGTRNSITADQDSSADTALARSIIESAAIAHSDYEVSQLSYLVSRGGFRIGNVLIGDSRVDNQQLFASGLAPGAVDFVLRWNTPGQYSDLNLLVIDPKGNLMGNPPYLASIAPNDPKMQAAAALTLPPGFQALAYSPSTTPTGGTMSLNHIGPGGLEVASWPASYPHGKYLVGVYNYEASTNRPVNFTLDVFLNGKLVIGDSAAVSPIFGKTTIADTDVMGGYVQLPPLAPSGGGTHGSGPGQGYGGAAAKTKK